MEAFAERFRRPSAKGGWPQGQGFDSSRFRPYDWRMAFLVRARGTRDRFELSALNGSAVFFAVLSSEFAVWFVGMFGVSILLVCGVVVLATLLSRRVLVVTPDDATFELRFFGIAVKRQALGIAPEVGDFGWDWDEVAIMPRDPALRRGLEDNERAIIVEQTDRETARALEMLVCAEIARLHAHHHAPPNHVYRTNARPS